MAREHRFLEAGGNLDTRSSASVGASVYPWEGEFLPLQDPPAPSAAPSPMAPDFPPQFMGIVRMMNSNDLRLSTTDQLPSLSPDMWYGPGPATPSDSPAHFVPQSLPGGIIKPAPPNVYDRCYQGPVNQGVATMFANNSHSLTPHSLSSHSTCLNTGPAMTNGYPSYLGFTNHVPASHPEVSYQDTPNYLSQVGDINALMKTAKAVRRRTKEAGPLSEQNKAAKQPSVRLGKSPLKKSLARPQKSALKAGLVALETAKSHDGELRWLEPKALDLQFINTCLYLEGSETPKSRLQQNEEKKYNVAPPDINTALRDSTRDIWAQPRDYYRNKGNGTVEMMKKIMAGLPISELRREYNVPRDEMLRRISMLATISLEALETQGMSKELFLEVLAQHEEGNGEEIHEIIEMMHQDREN